MAAFLLVAALLPLALWTLVRAQGMAAVLGFAGCGLVLALAWLARGAALVALVQLGGTLCVGLLLARQQGKVGEEVSSPNPSSISPSLAPVAPQGPGLLQPGGGLRRIASGTCASRNSRSGAQAGCERERCNSAQQRGPCRR